MRDLIAHPIRAFALLCVAATSLFLAAMAVRLNDVLASPDWCGKALQAEKISKENFGGGLTGCVSLLQVQLEALAMNSHIVVATFALCLLVLIVIVIAGGKLSFSASRDGISGNVGKDVEQAANEVAGAAVSRAEEISGERQQQA